MKKLLIGAAAAATLATSVATPAEAQYRDSRYDRRGGIDAGDIAVGVAVIGGVAAILSAVNRDGSRYGYNQRYRYRDGYSTAVNACGYEAERRSRGGNVRITDVDRRSNDRYRVRGVIEPNYGYGAYQRGYDRRYDRAYDRRYQRQTFTCSARGNGRITSFGR